MANIVEQTLEGAPDRLLERNFATALLWVIVALTVSLLLWACAGDRVDEVVHANGRVMPSSRLQVVSNLEGGIVKLTSWSRPATGCGPGSRCCASMPTASSSADFARNDTSIDAHCRPVRRGSMPRRAASRWYSRRNLKLAAPTLVANERALHNAQVASFATERDIARSRLHAGRAGRRPGARRGLRPAPRRYAQARREVEILAPLVEKGVEPRLMSLVRARSAEQQAASARDAASEAARRADASRSRSACPSMSNL
jgi:membrane fusion protein, adhesin transport system